MLRRGSALLRRAGDAGKDEARAGPPRRHSLSLSLSLSCLSISRSPLGLVDMFNAGGAVQGLSYSGGAATSAPAAATVCMEIKGCGRLGAYSATRPRRCSVGSAVVEFSYDSSSGLRQRIRACCNRRRPSWGLNRQGSRRRRRWRRSCGRRPARGALERPPLSPRLAATQAPGRSSRCLSSPLSL